MLNVNGEVVSESQFLAEKFNIYFLGIALKLKWKMTPYSNSFELYRNPAVMVSFHL